MVSLAALTVLVSGAAAAVFAARHCSGRLRLAAGAAIIGGLVLLGLALPAAT